MTTLNEISDIHKVFANFRNEQKSIVIYELNNLKNCNCVIDHQKYHKQMKKPSHWKAFFNSEWLKFASWASLGALIGCAVWTILSINQSPLQKYV